MLYPKSLASDLTTATVKGEYFLAGVGGGRLDPGRLVGCGVRVGRFGCPFAGPADAAGGVGGEDEDGADENRAARTGAGRAKARRAEREDDAAKVRATGAAISIGFTL